MRLGRRSRRLPAGRSVAGPRDQRRDEVTHHQYRAERARRTLHGIDEQVVAKAERAAAGKVPVKRNRFIRLVGADKSVNRTLEAKARARRSPPSS